MNKIHLSVKLFLNLFAATIVLFMVYLGLLYFEKRTIIEKNIENSFNDINLTVINLNKKLNSISVSPFLMSAIINFEITKDNIPDTKLIFKGPIDFNLDNSIEYNFDLIVKNDLLYSLFLITDKINSKNEYYLEQSKKINYLLLSNLRTYGSYNQLKDKKNFLNINIENSFIKIKTNFIFKKIKFKDGEHIIYGPDRRPFLLPKDDIEISYQKATFEITDIDKFKSFIYELYKLNYFASIDKKGFNNYLLDINQKDILSESEFNKFINNHIEDFKNQESGGFKFIFNTIYDAYTSNKKVVYNSLEIKDKILILEIVVHYFSNIEYQIQKGEKNEKK